MRYAIAWAIICVAAGVSLALAVGASGVQPGQSHIEITDKLVSETTFNGQRVITTLMFNRAFPTPIGNSILFCDLAGSRRGPIGRGSLQCLGTYRFAHGNLMVAGFMGKRGLYTLAVIGGTGVYSNTGAGQVAAVTIGLDPLEQLLTFTLYST